MFVHQSFHVLQYRHSRQRTPHEQDDCVDHNASGIVLPLVETHAAERLAWEAGSQNVHRRRTKEELWLEHIAVIIEA